MGNPSVRFDEGWEQVGHWPLVFQSSRSCLLYETKMEVPLRYLLFNPPASLDAEHKTDR
jgi:hypothetical protein